MKQSATLQEKIASYSKLNKGLKTRIKSGDLQLLGASALSLTISTLSFQSVIAQCQGAQATNLSIPENPNNLGIDIDIDGDGVDDFRIYDNFRAAGEATLNVVELNGGAVLTAGGSGIVKNYAANATINGVGNTNQFSNRWYLVFASGGNIQGPWGPPYPTSGYIGVIQDGKYGFIELTVNNGAMNGATATDYNISIAEAGLAVSSMQNVFANSCTSLPVELMSFEASTAIEAIQLAWQTASETNNAGFEVQRSENGKDFKTLAFVEGNGTTIEAQEYFFDDKILRTNQPYYYRLKQIDFDGTFEYSDIITAELKGETKASVTLAPNPTATDFTNLEYVATTSGKLAIQVFDVNGKQLLTLQSEVAAGMNNINLDLSALAAGMYFVKLEQGSVALYKRLVKN